MITGRSQLSSAAAAMAFSLLVSLASPARSAQNLPFTGTSSDGLAVTGSVSFGQTATASLEETLADGTLHRRFMLPPDPSASVFGGWRVKVGESPAFSASDENYQHGDLVGPQVDVYLRTDGQSALSLDWTLYPACHGGCLHTAKFHLDLRSDDAALFASGIDDGVFGRFDEAEGLVSRLYETNGPAGDDYRESRFTISAVPEPGTVLMLLAGLGIVGALTRTSGAHRWGSRQ